MFAAQLWRVLAERVLYCARFSAYGVKQLQRDVIAGAPAGSMRFRYAETSFMATSENCMS
jgi:hypothetical protein